MPGVQAATIGGGGLPFGGPQSTFMLDGQANAETRRITMNMVSADYLNALSIPLRQGRMLTEREIDAAEPLAVVNESAAKLWPAGENPIGRRLKLDTLEKPGSPDVLTPPNVSPYVTIVGVIGDTRNDDIRNDPRPAVFIPYTLLAPSQRQLAVRAQGDLDRARQRVAGASARDGPRTTRQRPDHLQRDTRFSDGAAALHYGALQSLRGARSCAGDGRHLRRPVLPGLDADARDRRAHGYGRATARHSLPYLPRGRQAGRRGLSSGFSQAWA